MRAILVRCVKWLIIIFNLPVVAQSFSQTPVERHEQLQVAGNQIVGEHNNPVQLMCMSLFWSLTDMVEASAALQPDAPVTGGWDPEKHLSVSGRFVREQIIWINSKKQKK